MTDLWARKGTRPRVVQDTRYTWADLFGAACPARAVAAGLVMPRADTQAMNQHLAEIARAVAPGAHAVVVMDGAGWHTASALRVPETMTILTLLPDAPERNPAENIWQDLRQNKLAPEQTRQSAVRVLRGDRRGVLQRLEQLR